MEFSYEKVREASLSDIEQSEALLEQAANVPLPSNSRQSSRRWRWVGHALFLTLNVVLLAVNISWSRPPPGPYSPAQDVVSYHTGTYNFSIFSKNDFNGKPRLGQKEAWTSLMSHQSVVLTAEELHALNRTSVKIPGEGYLAELSMFHQLHCLDYVRQYVYRDYYNVTEDPLTVSRHVSHCIDALRQVIQCHGDTSIITYSWRHDYRRPWPDFQIAKQCRSFDALDTWAAARRPTFAYGNPVNPHYDTKYNGTTPTDREDATELVQGTRINPQVLKSLGQL